MKLLQPFLILPGCHSRPSFKDFGKVAGIFASQHTANEIHTECIHPLVIFGESQLGFFQNRSKGQTPAFQATTESPFRHIEPPARSSTLKLDYRRFNASMTILARAFLSTAPSRISVCFRIGVDFENFRLCKPNIRPLTYIAQ